MGALFSIEMESKARDFVRIGRTLMATRSIADAAGWAEQRCYSVSRVVDPLKKAQPGSTENWGAEIAVLRQGSDAFVASLSHDSFFDRALAEGGLRLAAMNSRLVISVVPVTGAAVDQAAVKPVSELEFSPKEMQAKKAATILVFSDELARLSRPIAEQVFDAELRAAVGVATDAAVIAEIMGTAGVATPQSAGDDLADVLTDFSVALGLISGTSRSRYFAIVRPDTAKLWASLGATAGPNFQMTPTGGSIIGVRVLVSDAVDANTRAVFFDGAQLGADPGQVFFSPGRDATLDMAGGSSPTFSVFQRNCSALRAERVFGCKLLRASGAVVLEESATV